MIQAIRRGLLHASVPIQKVMQQIHRPEYKIDDEFYFSLTHKIRNGDTLLSREDWHFTNPFIPGYWKHAAIFSHGMVVEAVGEGVRWQSLARWCFTKDYIAALRPLFLSSSHASLAAIKAEHWIGKPYDYEFSAGLKALYCSELVLAAYESMSEFPPFTLRETFGVKTVTPTDFWNAEDKFDRVIVSKLS